MKKVVNDLRLMIKACDMYYNENLSQQEVASALNISRPTLSRLLNGAKEEKLIKIEVTDADFVRYWELSERIKEKYHLKDVLIADSGFTGEETKKNIGRIAAAYLGHLIKDQDVVGISMGSTLHQVVTEMEECRDKKITVIPLVGGVGHAHIKIHANSLAEHLAHLYNSEFHPIFAPARVYSRVTRNGLMKDMSVTTMMTYANKMDIAILGIGYPNEYSSIKTTGYFAENEMETLLQKGVAGEINMQFYDIQGDTAPFKEDNYVIGVEARKLKKVPLTIGIAGGMDKEKAIKGAVAGGFVNTLITDYNCALKLLEDDAADC